MIFFIFWDRFAPYISVQYHDWQVIFSRWSFVWSVFWNTVYILSHDSTMKKSKFTKNCFKWLETFIHIIELGKINKSDLILTKSERNKELWHFRFYQFCSNFFINLLFSVNFLKTLISIILWILNNVNYYLPTCEQLRRFSSITPPNFFQIYWNLNSFLKKRSRFKRD